MARILGGVVAQLSRDTVALMFRSIVAQWFTGGVAHVEKIQQLAHAWASVFHLNRQHIY